MKTKPKRTPLPRRAPCLWCEASMQGRRSQARFCSDLCRAMHHKTGK